MGKLIIVGTNNFLMALRNLKDRKEITLEQYAESLRRAKNL